MFAGIHLVDFNWDSTSIIAMKSSAGEIVKVDKPVGITEEVENWLGDLAKEMKSSLSNIFNKVVSSE